MIYPYKCPSCAKHIEEIKPHTESHIVPDCDDCGTTMKRIFGGHSIKICSDPDAWNPGLGCKNKDTKERLNVLSQDREVITSDSKGNKTKQFVEGVSLVETGNEKVTPPAKESNYDLTDKEIHEIGSALDG